MGIIDKVRSALGKGTVGEKTNEQDPSHRCESCREEYFTDPSVEITTCRGCGGTRVQEIA
jgi:ribosomal protein L37AE/L43A